MSTSVTIEGVDDVLTFLDHLVDSGKIEESVGQGCAVVERAAKQKAPKDTGALRRSIQSRVEKDDNEVRGTVFTPLEYAPYVEYGTGLFAEGGNGRKEVPWWYKDDKGEWHQTSGQKPHPYMRPALLENREKVLQTIKRGVGK